MTPDGTWQPFAPSAYAPVADLVAVRSDAAGVEPQTAFRFTSRTSTPATDLADRLEVAPAVGLKVSPGSSAAEAMIQPDERLIPGTSYRFRIRSDGGAVAASWAFRTKQPLHVVATIPADRATGVPVSTGIEATFDQDDVVGYTGKVSISPAVPFELELDGRTLAVVPQRALAERTVYTVTIARGIGVHGSDVTLEQDVILRFETAGRETSAVDRVEPQEMFAESSPAEAPVIGLAPACRPEGGALDQPVVVYRLPSFDAALTAARALLSAPSWATWSDTGLVATSGLPVVLRITAHVDLGCAQGQQVVAFPAPLPAGRYLVVFPLAGRDAQVLLQVSNLALYTRVSETRTVAWVNDMATGMAVPGATITIDGKGLGSTGADGLLVVDTPRSLAVWDGSRIAPVAIARSADAATLVALQPAEWLGGASGPADAYWLAFQTDRRAFRTTDTVGAWGVIRPRAGGSASGVEVRLLAGDATVSEVAPSIVRVAVTPDANGLFAAVLPIDGLPFGTYQVALMAGGSVVTSTWIEVDEIRKPAYRIDVSLDRHVLVTGDRFTASARATYFDGTPVPGLELSFAYSTAAPVTATTDATGSAQVRLTARLGGGTGSWGPSYESVEVTPLHPEEGTIAGRSDCRVYPAGVWPTATTKLMDGSLTVEGRLQVLDLPGLERAFGSDDQATEGGAPIAGRSVEIAIVQLIQHQRQTGSGYDWITKQTVPTYETWTEDRTVTSLSRMSDPDGRFTVSAAVPDARGQYRIRVTAKDSNGRTASADAWADERVERAYMVSPRLTSAADATECCATYAVGEQIALSVADPVPPQLPGADRYLFTVAQRGIREVLVRASATLDRSFVAADVPNVSIDGVEFTGRSYVEIAGVTPSVRLATEEVTIALKTDAASYRPGAEAQLDIRTTGPDGRATAASLVVQAVDEKLYRAGLVEPVDLLSELYRSLPPGIVWRGGSHLGRGGADETFGGGDTTGGGPRAEFHDSLLFRRVTTDANGRASVAFKLGDDLTSWRVTAAAVDSRRHAGTGTIQVPIGLPFFVEATTAPEYLVSDRPVLRLRAYGTSLKAGQAVSFGVSAPTLGLASTTVSGTAFKTSTVPLPRLTTGTHRMQVTGTTVGATPALADSLVRTVRVVESRYQEITTASGPLEATFRATGGDGLTTYVISEGGRAPVAWILERLLWADGARIDQALGAAAARDLLIERFGRDPVTLPETRFESSAYVADGGISLLPYSSADLTLTARIALAAPDRFGHEVLVDALRKSVGDAHSTQTRERGLVALAGLAALGEPVAGEVALFARQPSLSPIERLYLGIAYAGLGDDSAARGIERDLLTEFGRSMGPWVRLDVSPSRDEVVDATGLLAILAASLGDAVAARAQAYVEATPPKSTVLALEELAFVRHSLERLDPRPASFAWTLDGTRHVVDLAATGSFTLTLTADQRRTLRLEPVVGQMSVTSSWLAPARPGVRPADPDVRIVRSVLPGLSVGQDEMVRVRITATFAGTATDGCYEITERVPSGLAPLPVPDQSGFGTSDRSKTVITPFAVAGQLVSFCASPGMPKLEAVYSARVVSPGTYTWEPASVASSAGGERVSLTDAATLTIE